MLALAAFLITVILVLWRPGRIHEAIPALIGAFAMFVFGLVDRADVLQVGHVVWNSAMTIISTFVMASVLEGAGFFDWVGDRLLERAGGSGRRLFHLLLAFSACLTLFLNNDGSIFLGTPVILALLRRLRLPRQTEWAYLIAACLIASASSPPIGVSNMANLEAMTLVGISLNKHLHFVAFPAVLGLATCWAMLRFMLGRHLPERLDLANVETDWADPGAMHPHAVRHGVRGMPTDHRSTDHPPRSAPLRPRDWSRIDVRPARRSDPAFMWFAVGVVILVRLGFFVASAEGWPTYTVSVAGALLLLAVNLTRRVTDTRTVIMQAPWAILAFAFGMDLVVFGLRTAGLIGLTAHWLGNLTAGAPANAGVFPGLLTTGVSALLNNHPGLIIGALTLTEMGTLSSTMLYSAYAGVVLGADLGALVTPVGTLACLIWFHILAQHGRRYSWWEFLRITLVVIPVSLVIALGGLYLQTMLLLG
ncbi:MAG: arsenic transporter [Symbiobacteriaceae bacterium]|jgi:arsenical pump membrane protein|nr:arsenic transporter [Symbiobacteriaceae bacterium]